MKTLHLAIIATMIITIDLISSLPVVFAEESITVSTDRTSYQYGENYTISGKVNPVVLDQAISIVILSPNYPHPESLSISPNSDGRYSYTLPLTINDISSANFTVIAQYAGAKNQTTFSYTGLPCNQQSIPAHVYAPIIRGPPAYNPRLLDSSGNAIIGPVKVGQQIQITYTLANGLNCAQPFAYIVQIQDLNGKTVSLSWITGTLLAGQSLNPAQSWTPQHNGTYTAQIFTWQSINNPNALAPPVSFSFDVEPNSNLTQPSQLMPRILSNCNEGFIHIIKKEDGSTDCVKPDTAQILIQRGWAKEIRTSMSEQRSEKLQVLTQPSNESLPSCASHVEHQEIFAGNAGAFTCYPGGFSISNKIINYTGFYGVYHDLDSNVLVRANTYGKNTAQEQLDSDGNKMAEGNFVLEPGHNGTITFQMTGHSPKCIGNCPQELNLPSQVNITNVSSFIHHQNGEIISTHLGLGISYEPRSETVTDNGTIIVKTTLSAAKDAPQGTYWVELSPGSVCSGGILLLLTVSVCGN